MRELAKSVRARIGENHSSPIGETNTTQEREREKAHRRYYTAVVANGNCRPVYWHRQELSTEEKYKYERLLGYPPTHPTITSNCLSGWCERNSENIIS